MTKTIIEIYEEQQKEIEELQKRVKKLEKRMDSCYESLLKIADIIDRRL